jgi:hypothetical protein
MLSEGPTSCEGRDGVTVTGRYLDLLDPELPVINSRDLGPGDVIWFRDLDQDDELVLASAGRIRDLDRTGDRVSFRCEAPAGVSVITALRSPEPPQTVDGAEWTHDADAGILRLRHPGAPTGTPVTIGW